MSRLEDGNINSRGLSSLRFYNVRFVHRSPLIVQRSSFIAHRSSLIVHRSSFTAHRSSFTVQNSSSKLGISLT
jgi:hypothetical protein